MQLQMVTGLCLHRRVKQTDQLDQLDQLDQVHQVQRVMLKSQMKLSSLPHFAQWSS